MFFPFWFYTVLFLVCVLGLVSVLLKYWGENVQKDKTYSFPTIAEVFNPCSAWKRNPNVPNTSQTLLKPK